MTTTNYEFTLSDLTFITAPGCTSSMPQNRQCVCLDVKRVSHYNGCVLNIIQDDKRE